MWCDVMEKIEDKKQTNKIDEELVAEKRRSRPSRPDIPRRRSLLSSTASVPSIAISP